MNASARLGHVARFSIRTLLGLCGPLALGSGCAATSGAIRGAGEVQKGHSYLLCVDADNDPAIVELKLTYPTLVLGRAPDRAECVKARLIVESVANNCIDRTQCSLPQFIDGKPTDIPESAVDRVLVISELHIESRMETVKEQRSNGPTPAGGGGRGGRGGPGAGGSTTVTTTRFLDAAGRTGLLFIYDPKAPRIVGAANVSKAPPHELAQTLTNMERAAR